MNKILKTTCPICGNTLETSTLARASRMLEKLITGNIFLLNSAGQMLMALFIPILLPFIVLINIFFPARSYWCEKCKKDFPLKEIRTNIP